MSGGKIISTFWRLRYTNHAKVKAVCVVKVSTHSRVLIWFVGKIRRLLAERLPSSFHYFSQKKDYFHKQ